MCLNDWDGERDELDDGGDDDEDESDRKVKCLCSRESQLLAGWTPVTTGLSHTSYKHSDDHNWRIEEQRWLIYPQTTLEHQSSVLS